MKVESGTHDGDIELEMNGPVVNIVQDAPDSVYVERIALTPAAALELAAALVAFVNGGKDE